MKKPQDLVNWLHSIGRVDVLQPGLTATPCQYVPYEFVFEAELAPIKDAIEQACDRLDVPYRFIQFYRIERLGTKEDAYFHALRLENLPRGRKRKSGQSN